MALQKWTFFSFSSFILLTFIAGAQCGEYFTIIFVDPETKSTCVLDGTEKIIECKDMENCNDAQLWKQSGSTIINKKTGNITDAQGGLKEGVRCITYSKKDEKDSDNQQWELTPKQKGKISSKVKSQLVFTMSKDKACTIQKESSDNQRQEFVVV